MRRRALALCLILWAICPSADDRAVVFAQSDPRIGGSQPSAADRLHVAVIFLMDHIQRAMVREEARIQRMCENADDAHGCADGARRPFSVHFVRVRTAPSFTAPIVGNLFITEHRSQADWPVSLVYRAAADGRPRTWLRDVDGGYGPWLSGVRSRGGWIGLSGVPFDGDVWIYVGANHHNLRGEAATIAGWVLELHDVPVRSADGPIRVLPSGSFFIKQVDRDGVVTFREELPIDMPCGEDVSAPAVMPPVYRAPASAFFDARGRPRFAVKYTKGC